MSGRGIFAILVAVAAGAAQPTRPVPHFVIDPRLVNVTFTVTDQRGSFRPDLESDDFEVEEDGERRAIAAFSREHDLPLTLGLLFETKEVTPAFLEVSRRLTLAFLRGALRPEDGVFLIAMRADPRLLLDKTGSLDAVESVFSDLDRHVQSAPLWRSGFSYHILDDLALALERKLAAAHGRKAIVLIQAGWDWRSKTRPGDLIESLQHADVLVYHLKIPNTIDKVRFINPVIAPLDLLFIRRPMRQICEETGGRQFPEKEFGTALQTIEQELRSSYTIAFRPGRTVADGNLHRIAIRSRRPGMVVRHRHAYRDAVASPSK